MNQPEIISFHPGRQHNFEQAVQLNRLFEHFKHATSLHFSSTTVKGISRYSKKIGSALAKRSSEMPAKTVHSFPTHELNLLIKRGLGKKIGALDFVFRNEKFQRSLLQKFDPPKVCIGYDTSSWVVFKEWKNKSKLILDLSIAVPQYKKTLAATLNCKQEMIDNLTKGDEHLYKIYEQEVSLADVILCGSQFVKDSCLSLGVPESKLKILPYGADLKKFDAGEKTPEERAESKIKIVFIGSVNHRKGADILFDAWKEVATLFPHAELHFFGGVSISVPENLPNVHFHGFVSQKQLVEAMRTAQISILPTFFEGSSLAIYQSMAMGLAVITTPNAGSIITHGLNGLLIPYGSVEEVKTAVVRLINDENFRNKIAAQGKKDIQQYTWENYGIKLANIISGVLGENASRKHYFPAESSC